MTFQIKRSNKLDGHKQSEILINNRRTVVKHASGFTRARFSDQYAGGFKRVRFYNIEHWLLIKTVIERDSARVAAVKHNQD